MTVIANQWTGDGLADGTTITAGNVNTAGNGSTVTRNVSGSPTFVTEGHGFRASVVTAGDIARLDASFSGTGVRTQIVLTMDVAPPSSHTPIGLRNATDYVGSISVHPERTLQLRAGNLSGVLLAGSLAPAVALGDQLVIDMVIALAAVPTTSNGRLFYRVKNLTNPTWNTAGEFFYDSGYTLNVGTTNFTAARYGKQSANLPAPGAVFEYLGWETVAVNPADTSEAQAKAYFADDPTTVPVPLDTPAVTVVSQTDPTTAGGTDGTITVSWPAVPDADHYEAGWAAGDVTEGFAVVSSSATSPYVFTGRSAGVQTVAIRAIPAA
jgi:hypothetical protein